MPSAASNVPAPSSVSSVCLEFDHPPPTERKGLTVFDVAGPDGSARAALVDRHFAGQNLSIVNYTFCADPGLLASQLQAVAQVVNSQQR